MTAQKFFKVLINLCQIKLALLKWFNKLRRKRFRNFFRKLAAQRARIHLQNLLPIRAVQLRVVQLPSGPTTSGSTTERSNYEWFNYRAVQLRVVFSTRRIIPAIHKDVLPTFQQSNVVYEYVCHCDSRYVGQTSQRLQD